MKTVCETIAQIIEECVEGIDLRERQYEEKLTDLGVDSLAFVQIIVLIEEKLQVEFPDECLLISESDTINKIASIVIELKQDYAK